MRLFLIFPCVRNSPIHLVLYRATDCFLFIFFNFYFKFSLKTVNKMKILYIWLGLVHCFSRFCKNENHSNVKMAYNIFKLAVLGYVSSGHTACLSVENLRTRTFQLQINASQHKVRNTYQYVKRECMTSSGQIRGRSDGDCWVCLSADIPILLLLIPSEIAE